MRKIAFLIRFLLSCLLCVGVLQAAFLVEVDAHNGVPGRDTPKKLAEAWLRFHADDLCQRIEADFTFSDDGMEVRGLIEDDDAYRKFERILRPLRGSHRIELFLERRKEEGNTEKGKERNPPASLWENYELRSYLGDVAARARQGIDFEDDLTIYPTTPPSQLVKQRLMIYAEQVLAWNSTIEGYAKHIPLLTRVAQDEEMSPGLRSRARATVLAHARKMEKLVSRLHSNLKPAFPRPGRRDRDVQPEDNGGENKEIIGYADHISRKAQTVCQDVHKFIYPERYTVGLDELRRPSLLDSLKALQKLDSDFQKALAKAR